MSTDSVLLHICTMPEWQAVADARVAHYSPASLTEVGFIHLSAAEQVHLPANRLYSNRDDLVLLVIDPAALDTPVRWEPGVPEDPSSMLFPHLYGALPVAAVVDVRAYLPGADGLFGTPELS